MCIKLPKQLNPYAESWSPPPPSPPPQPPITVLRYPSAIAAYPISMYKMSQHYYWPPPTSPRLVPTGNGRRENPTKPTSDEISIPTKNSKSHVQKCPPGLGGFKNGFPRHRPPRVRSVSEDHKKPSKLRWRPKKLVEPVNETAVDGGAVDLTQPVPLPVAPASGQGWNTTVMIKNIPNRLRRDDILEFLDGYCRAYSLEYDFLYLPMDFRKKGNLGYAFVNFTTGVAANKFKKILQNFKWETFRSDDGSFISKKICEITWARIQGKEVYTRRFKNSEFACEELDFLPVVLDPPRNGSDPNPCPPLVIGNVLRRRFPSKKY
ncbi:protein MEI2-like 7 [Henckelia pumila]|uniref:protein MEI2-like 7 n=1 Tax=Henckelia pumila TaxID=405737 RepID=UPI003C6E7AC1